MKVNAQEVARVMLLFTFLSTPSYGQSTIAVSADGDVPASGCTDPKLSYKDHLLACFPNGLNALRSDPWAGKQYASQIEQIEENVDALRRGTTSVACFVSEISRIMNAMKILGEEAYQNGTMSEIVDWTIGTMAFVVDEATQGRAFRFDSDPYDDTLVFPKVNGKCSGRLALTS